MNYLRDVALDLSRRDSIKIMFVLGVITRVIYSILFGDPMSGQDAPTYMGAATAILSDGPFAEVHTSPYFPIGYSWFTASILFLSGSSLFALEIVQIMLFCLSALLFCNSIARHYGKPVANILATLLFFSPALISASVQIMYEIPMLSLVMLVIRFLLERRNSETAGPQILFFFFIGLLGAIAATFQPKVLVPLIVSVAIHLWIVQKKKSRFFQERIPASVLVLTMLLGPAALMIRNNLSGDGLGITGNFASNIVIGAQKAGVEIDASKCVDFDYYNHDLYFKTFDSAKRTICFLQAKYENPVDGLHISLIQARNYWLPYIGNLKFQGTWYHGLDFRRLLPEYKYWKEPWSKIDNAIGYLWVVSWLFMAALGLRAFVRNFGMREASFWILPILSLYAVSIMAYGESRYRLPVAYAYYFLIAYGIHSVIVRKRNRDVEGLI